MDMDIGPRQLKHRHSDGEAVPAAASILYSWVRAKAREINRSGAEAGRSLSVRRGASVCTLRRLPDGFRANEKMLSMMQPGVAAGGRGAFTRSFLCSQRCVRIVKLGIADRKRGVGRPLTAGRGGRWLCGEWESVEIGPGAGGICRSIPEPLDLKQRNSA